MVEKWLRYWQLKVCVVVVVGGVGSNALLGHSHSQVRLWQYTYNHKMIFIIHLESRTCLDNAPIYFQLTSFSWHPQFFHPYLTSPKFFLIHNLTNYPLFSSSEIQVWIGIQWTTYGLDLTINSSCESAANSNWRTFTPIWDLKKTSHFASGPGPASLFI